MIPPDQDDTEFVYHMEDVLSLYKEPYDPDRPLICFDEHPKNSPNKCGNRARLSRARLPAKTTSTNETAPRTCFWPLNRSPAGER